MAYLTSTYPAVSHTFVQREVSALRARGMEVQTFSVRRPLPTEIVGEDDRREMETTRWLVPQRTLAYARAWLWLLSRLSLSMSTFRLAVGIGGLSARQRLLWLFYSLEAALLAYWLASERFDHLHCHFGNNGASTGMLAARLAGIPFSFTCHGSELLDPRRHRLADKVSQASFVVCVSKYGRAQLMMLCPPGQWEKMHVIRCGPPSGIRGTPAEKMRGDEILCVGRLSAEKGHLVLLEAIRLLKPSGWQGRCVLVGEGPLRAAIENRVRELELGDAVQLAGALASDEVMRRYAAADVVVLSSFSEGIPVVLMEAMACHRPVVATAVGGVPELVIHGVTGLLVAPGDPRELAEGIRRVLRDPDLACELARNGAAHVASEFEVQKSAARLERLFLRGRFEGLQRPAAEQALSSRTA